MFGGGGTVWENPTRGLPVLNDATDYAPGIALTSKKLLVVTFLSFLSRIYVMLFDSLALEKLRMLSK